METELSPSTQPTPAEGRRFFSPTRAKVRRAMFFGTAFVVNAIAVFWLEQIFQTQGVRGAHILILCVFALLNGLLVLGSMHALVGAFDWLRNTRAGVRITKLAGGGEGPLKHRYAVVMPVYNEDIVRVCGRLEAIYHSLDKAGHLASYDFFILSDTTDLNCWIAEEVAWTNMCRRLKGFGRIYYRRRRKNENRKAGNIGDFVRNWGGNYEGMVVLDADSLMDGGDIVTMTRTMEAYPRLGILQTPPRLIRGSSTFTRLQQFAMRLYGPMFIRGLNYWQLGEGSYWGHNALIRMKPFSEFCELPALPGREPFGGRILSHDFVEAALMVKQGWEVWLAWDISGTYEEAPPTLVDHLKRDRRWCQGNLQHMWLIFARKLLLPSRAHLFMGIMAYLGGPLWFLFMVLCTWVALDRRASDLSKIAPPDNLLERFLHVQPGHQTLWLVGFVLCLLFLPKFIALFGAVLRGRIRRAFGGFFPLVIGVTLEMILSMLLAPSIMIAHVTIVMGMVLGRSVGWNTQNRETDGTAWTDAAQFHGPATIIGIAWSWLAWYIDKDLDFLMWMSPVLAGLVFSIPISVYTSRVSLGRALANKKILATPEEINPPQVMLLADNADAAVDAALDASVPNRSGIIAAVVDPYVNGVHVSLLAPGEPSDKHERETELAEKCLHEGPDALSKDEKAELLYHSPSMLLMHRAVWLRPLDTIHPVWAHALETYRRRLDAPHEAEAV